MLVRVKYTASAHFVCPLHNGEVFVVKAVFSMEVSLSLKSVATKISPLAAK